MKISFKNEDEIKDFSDKQKLRVLITNRPALMQGILRQKKKKKNPDGNKDIMQEGIKKHQKR